MVNLMKTLQYYIQNWKYQKMRQDLKRYDVVPVKTYSICISHVFPGM